MCAASDRSASESARMPATTSPAMKARIRPSAIAIRRASVLCSCECACPCTRQSCRRAHHLAHESSADPLARIPCLIYNLGMAQLSAASDARELTAAVQDYTKAIYTIESRDGAASTTELAALLEVRPASVSGMLRKLSALGLVEHEPYHGVRLTER